MGKQEDKILDGVASLLAPGEQALVAVVAQPKGTTMGNAGRGALGAAGAAMGGGQRRQASAAAAGSGIPVASPCAVVLTGQRLLTVKIGAPIGLGLGGKVKELLGAVPLAEVEGIDVKKVALRQSITLHVRGQSIQLEANAAASGAQLASTFESLKGA